MISPPADVLDSLSQFVYQAVISLIQYENRVLYEGVTVDDGWALLRQLRESQAHLGLYIHMLEARRNALQCETLADYAAFKSSVLQLKHDWTAAINNLLIPVDDDWSLRKTKVFISDRTGPIFGEELAIWNADPANEAKTVDQLREHSHSRSRCCLHSCRHHCHRRYHHHYPCCRPHSKHLPTWSMSRSQWLTLPSPE